jgi:hypothetical protein
MVAQAAIVGGVALFVAAVGFTHGSTQGTLISLAAVPFMLGVAELIFFRSNGEPRFFDPRWLPRWGKRLAIAAVVVTCVIATLQSLRQRQSAAMAIARLRAEQAQRELERATAQRNAPLPPVEPPNDVARTGNQSNPPAESKIPVEEVFRKMNALANESNGTEFQKYLGSPGPRPELSIAQQMEPFYGRIAWMKTEPQSEKAIVGAFAEKEMSGFTRFFFQIEKGKWLSVITEMVRPDASREFARFYFQLINGEWLYWAARYPLYRSAARVEFRAQNGDALEILRLHLGNMVAPAAGETDRFDVVGEDRDPSESVRLAKSNLDNLTQSLGKAGLSVFLKTIHEPELLTPSGETQAR